MGTPFLLPAWERCRYTFLNYRPPLRVSRILASPHGCTDMSKDRFVRHANLMSVLTILSRFAGLARDKICSYYVGVGPDWSAFWIGFIFPNLFRRIFGEGALTAVFVPIYTETLQKHGQQAANRLASATVTLLVLVLSVITLIGEAITIPIALARGVSPENRLAAAMIAIMLPYCVMVCLVAIMGAIATVHEKFTAKSLSPIILNLFMAGAAALAVACMTREYPLQKRVYWVAFSVLAAGIIQVAQMVPTLWTSGVPPAATPGVSRRRHRCRGQAHAPHPSRLFRGADQHGDGQPDRLVALAGWA